MPTAPGNRDGPATAFGLELEPFVCPAPPMRWMCSALSCRLRGRIVAGSFLTTASGSPPPWTMFGSATPSQVLFTEVTRSKNESVSQKHQAFLGAFLPLEATCTSWAQLLCESVPELLSLSCPGQTMLEGCSSPSLRRRLRNRKFSFSKWRSLAMLLSN